MGSRPILIDSKPIFKTKQKTNFKTMNMTRKLTVMMLMNILLMSARAGGSERSYFSGKNVRERIMLKNDYQEKLPKDEKTKLKEENIEKKKHQSLTSSSLKKISKRKKTTNAEEIKPQKATILPKAAQEILVKYSLKLDAQKYLHVTNKNEYEKEYMMQKREENMAKNIMKYLAITENHDVKVNEHSELLFKGELSYKPWVHYPHRFFPVAVEYKQDVYVWWSTKHYSYGALKFVYRKFPYSQESISFLLDDNDDKGFSLSMKGTRIENMSGNSKVWFELEDANKTILNISDIVKGYSLTKTSSGLYGFTSEPLIKFVERNFIWIDVEEIKEKVMNY